MNVRHLFDTKAQSAKRARALKTGMFLQNLVRDELLERVQSVNREFKSIAVVTGFPKVWEQVFTTSTIVSDDEILQLESHSFDLVIHALGLHHANDPVGQVVQCAQALRPDGLFIAACFGGQNLIELRTALSSAEIQLCGGISPRVTPMAQIRDLGGILQRAGLALPVADALDIPTKYNSLFHIMRDLRDMGETNIMCARTKSFSSRSLLECAQKNLKSEFSDGDGKVNCTFGLVFLSGWAPDATQPKPLKPGSVTQTLQQSLQASKPKLND